MKTIFMPSFVALSVYASGQERSSFSQQIADSFNRNCTGAVTTTLNVHFGEENLPKPLEVESRLRASIMDIIGINKGADKEPSFSRLQADLELLNISRSQACDQFRITLEREFYVYGLKGWVERAGASSYFLIRRSKAEPQMLELNSYYTW